MNAAVSKAKPSKKSAPQPVAIPVSNKDAKESPIQVVESGSCASLTGGSTLGFDVGRDSNSTLFLRIRSNSAQGKFNKHWVPLNSLMDALGSAKGPITSGTLRSVCRRVSANQSGFLLSLLLSRGLVQRLPDKQRGYALGPAFSAGTKQLAKPAASAPSAKPLKAKAAAKSKSR